jgi:hypothetical protein
MNIKKYLNVVNGFFLLKNNLNLVRVNFEGSKVT